MRRLAILAVLALLGASAQAQPTPTPTPKPTPQAPASKPAPRAPVPTALPAPAVSGPSLAPRSPLPNGAADAASAQCSAQCSRTYYACLAGDNAESCSGDWAQCRVSCGNAARRSVSPGMSAGR